MFNIKYANNLTVFTLMFDANSESLPAPPNRAHSDPTNRTATVTITNIVALLPNIFEVDSCICL